MSDPAPTGPMDVPIKLLPGAPRRAAETVRLYAADWAGFEAWCWARGAVPLPATPASVAGFLASLTHQSPGSLGRKRAAIAARHRAAGLPPPILDPALRAVPGDVRRATPSRQPLSAAEARRLALSCPDDLAGRRDRALLLLLAATRLGRTGATRLAAEHIRFTATGAELGDHHGQVVSVARDPDPRACPVRALEAWLRASDTGFGPVFRKIDRWGKLGYPALGADAVRRIVARRSGTSRHFAPGGAAGPSAGAASAARPDGAARPAPDSGPTPAAGDGARADPAP